jgi:2-oxoglutarate ferredoxin oxidoreductase subunit beta
MQDPNRLQLLHHERGLKLSAGIGRVYRNQLEHDPMDMDAARHIASSNDPIPVGILYHNPSVPCYEDLKRSTLLRTPELIRSGLQDQFDKYTIWPKAAEATPATAAHEAA